MALENVVCIVTGAGSGIGRATALMMADQGARLVLVGRTLSKLVAVQQEIESSGGTAMANSLDVADRDAVFRMAAAAAEAFGRIDVLVNNAGHSTSNRRLLNTTPEDIQDVLGSNLIGTIYCTQAVVPTMLKADKGTVINVASLAGATPSVMGGAIYGPAKAAVINFTGFLNVEFNDTGIRASVVIPGEVDTPAMDRRPVVPSALARARMVTAEDVAQAITLIASLPQASSIPELVVRPTTLRDYSKEVAQFP